MPKIADTTATTPYLVARRLRKLTVPQIARRDDQAMRWIGQAIETINKLAKERQRLTMKLSNYTRPRGMFSGGLIGGGYIRPVKDRRRLAENILDALEGPRLLWRLPSGMYQLRAEGQDPASNAELLGLFDLGATVDDVLEAIE